MENVEKAIEEIVRDRFSNIKIISVDVEEGEDHDGDPVLLVRVVFDAEIDDFDASRLSGITRHLRTKLFDMDESRFPLTRFVSRKDVEGAAA